MESLSINQEAQLSFEWLRRSRPSDRKPFHIGRCLFFEGPLVPHALECAINAIIDRHETLRTEFTDISRLTADHERAIFERMRTPDGWKTRLFAKSVRTGGVGIDLQVKRLGSHATLTHPSFSESIEAEVARPFELHTAPLVRATLFQADDKKHALVLVFHHLVSDGWSALIFVQELIKFYRLFVENRRDSLLAPLSSRFSDLVASQWAAAMDEAWLARLGTWQIRHRRWAQHGLTFRHLSALRPSRGSSQQRVSTLTLGCGSAVTNMARTYCRMNGTTLYICALANLYVLCHLYSKATSVAVWGPFANRPSGTEDVIGWLAEGRVLGATLDSQMTFQAVVMNVRRLVFEALTDQHLPMGAIQHHLDRRGHDTLHGPESVHVSLNVIDHIHKQPIVVAGGLTMVPVQLVPLSVFRNSLGITIERSSELTLRCTFSPSELSASGVQTLMRDFVNLLEECLEWPTRPLKHIAVSFSNTSS